MSTTIEWVRNPDGTPGEVWNVVTGCSKTSPGCLNCYAERMTARFRKDHRPWTSNNAAHNVVLHPERLEQPLRWRKPRRVFVNSMSDLFHERVPFPFIAAVFGFMAHTQDHTYQVLTKRPARALEFFDWLGALRGSSGSFPCDPLLGCEIQAARHLPAEWSVKVANHFPKPRWPLPNVWLGISAEDQKTRDERVRWLFRTPAAVRWVSLEPLLEPINLRCLPVDHSARLDWVIVGGESGPGARPMDVQWVREIVEQCSEAGVPCFVKQLGANPFYEMEIGTAKGGCPRLLKLKDRKGGDPKEWPEDLNVRQFPE